MNLQPNTERSNNEIPIVSMRVMDAKHHKWGGRYAVRVELTDNAGEKHYTRITSDRARTLPDSIARYQKSIDGNCVSVSGGMIVQKWVMG